MTNGTDALPYDINDRKSIYRYAIDLRGSTLREKTGADGIADIRRNKGSFGSAVETHYFMLDLNNESEADFKAGCSRGIVAWRKPCKHFPEMASRICDNGKTEIGDLYCIEKVIRSGMLKATYEYNIYHWLESDEWRADVISPHGWYDLDDGELKRILHELRIAEL